MWKNFVNNQEVRRKILCPRVQFLEQALNQNWVKWLKHVLSISTERQSRCMLFCGAGSEWKMVHGGQ